MTRTKTKAIRDDQVMVAWQGGSTVVDGVDYTWSRGTRWRANHPAVKQMGSLAWVEDGIPQSEWPTSFDRVIEDGERQAAAEAKAQAAVKTAPAIPPSTPVGDLLVCHTEVLTSSAGPCREGAVVLRSDPRAIAAPEAFRPLLETLPAFDSR